MSTSLEELRKSYSLLMEISKKTRSILGALPAEVETLIEDLSRELVGLEGFDRDAKTTWSLHPRKRRLEKQIKKGIPKIEDALSKSVHLHVDILRKHLDELKKLEGAILAFDVQLGRKLARLSFPSTQGGFSTVLPVLARFVSTLEKLSTGLRESILKQVSDLLEQNRAVIKTYDRFVGIDKSDVPLSAERDSIDVVSIPDLFKIRTVLREEHEYLTSRRGEVVNTMRAKLRSSLESTLSLLETAKGLNLRVPATISTQIKEIIKQTGGKSNLTSLLGLVQQFDGQLLKASSEVRSQILSYGHELNSTLAGGNVPLDASFLPPQPSELPKDADLSTLITGFERLQAYKTNMETAIRSETMRILDELSRAVKLNVLPNNAALSQFVTANTKEVRGAKLQELTQIYSTVSSRLGDEHAKVVADIRTLEGLLTRISDAARTILDKTAMASTPPPAIRTTELAFPELVDGYARLKKHVQNRIELFRKAWERELNALLADVQVIKPAYRESFKAMEEFLQQAITRIRTSTNFDEIEDVAREARGDALYKAQDAIEKLKYRLDLKLRLAVSKLLGMNLTIPPEVQAAIQELTAIVPASETYEEAIRKAHAIVELFERRIVGYFNQTLSEQVKSYSELMLVSSSLGISTGSQVKHLVKFQEKLPADIEELPDRFDELHELLTSPELLRDIRNKADEVWRSLNSVTDLLERHGQAELVANLKNLLARVPEQLTTESVTTVLEIGLALMEAQKSVLDIIRNLERRLDTAFEQKLEEGTEYYSTVKRVFMARPKEFSEIIFPLETMTNLRQRLIGVASLTEAIDLFTTIRQLESQWYERLLEIDSWHKALRVFLADFNPAAPKAERSRQLDEIEKRIRETYSKEDVASYLSWAARELAAVMSEKQQKTKKKTKKK